MLHVYSFSRISNPDKPYLQYGRDDKLHPVTRVCLCLGGLYDLMEGGGTCRQKKPILSGSNAVSGKVVWGDSQKIKEGGFNGDSRSIHT